ncbi:GyrI-like domain-containing protein [Cellulophaga sp. HaHaR_3_176]|uniref:GyrI-like domain-containing protein n=1 Tax=Cellulophaga sp. HaHaR_3_176 TaxID=1942464 RepID=UPI001C1FAF35|nr:GyrI-like domain-containing protein [Cellulophaga sp. HaHaR_3_176]QWX85485.1 GyrI-like domain-containing protein [Cellulophaga sp. HaHaR_3_176]
MKHRIEILSEKKLVGKWLTMSYVDNKTQALWKSFMPMKENIQNVVSNDLYSMQIYKTSLVFKNFNPNENFIKWAAIEVSDFDQLNENLETHTLKGGLYAVFNHKGNAEQFQKTFNAIFQEWLPKSDYVIDNREHFELLGEKYSNTSPDSEEEIWIPIQLKSDLN